jgi:hypothetical protein
MAGRRHCEMVDAYICLNVCSGTNRSVKCLHLSQRVQWNKQKCELLTFVSTCAVEQTEA